MLVLLTPPNPQSTAVYGQTAFWACGLVPHLLTLAAQWHY